MQAHFICDTYHVLTAGWFDWSQLCSELWSPPERSRSSYFSQDNIFQPIN